MAFLTFVAFLFVIVIQTIVSLFSLSPYAPWISAEVHKNLFLPKLKKNMAYVIVEWEDGALSVVSKLWLTPLKKEAFWPPYKEQRIFNKLLKENEVNIDESWKLYKVKRCMFESDDLERAIKKCKEAEDTSNLDSDETNSTIKRRPKPKRILSSSDEDEPRTKIRKKLIERPPKLSIPEYTPSCLQDRFSAENVFAVAGTSTGGPKYRSLESFTGNLSGSTPTGGPKYRSLERSFPENLSVSTLTGGPHSCGSELEPKIDHKVLSLLYQIREQNDQILKHLSKSKAPEVGTSIDLPVELPLGDLKQLDELERFLALDDNLSRMVSYLSSLGGKDSTSLTNRILRHLLKDSLASSFSFKGKKSKQAFCDLTLSAIIIRSVKKALNSTDAEVEGIIKIWLKHAPQRSLKKRTVNNLLG